MNFCIEELADESKSYFEIENNKDCLKKLKNLSVENDNKILVKIGFDTIFLGEKLYGKSKKESVLIQKNNCKKLLKFYKICKKAVKILNKKFGFDGKIYINNLKDKKNNNDLMIKALLDVDFNKKMFKKLNGAYEYACDFFDAENSLNKMCDFHDNHCTKHRDKGIDKTTGCCPSFCKVRVVGKPCAHKNLSCKIFMCDYLINEKGYYFTPNTVPVLCKHMTALERAVCFGILCRTQKKSLRYLWFVRGLTLLYILLMIFIALTICF